MDLHVWVVFARNAFHVLCAIQTQSPRTTVRDYRPRMYGLEIWTDRVKWQFKCKIVHFVCIVKKRFWRHAELVPSN